MRFEIDPNSPVPHYMQLKKSIMLEILANRLKDGDKLPSVRQLAKLMKLNPGTVAKAYSALVDEGCVQSRPGSGYKVTATHSGADNLKRIILEDEFKNVLEKAFSMGFKKADIHATIDKLLDGNKHENSSERNTEI